jgi:uncharacterized protein
VSPRSGVLGGNVLEQVVNIIQALNGADFAWIMAGAFAGGLVNGLTGFGTGVSALPFWVQAVEPIIAAQMAAGAAVASQLSTLKAIWHAINWRELRLMLLAGIAAVPLGIMGQAHIDAGAFKAFVGAITIVYAVVMLSAGGRMRIAADNPTSNAAIGFVGGFMGGIAGISGVPPTIWAALNGWSKARSRGVFQAFNLTILATMLLASLVTGSLGLRYATLLLTALPATFLGVWTGGTIYRRLDDRRFDKVVLLLLLVSGIVLIWPLAAPLTVQFVAWAA